MNADSLAIKEKPYKSFKVANSAKFVFAMWTRKILKILTCFADTPIYSRNLRVNS